MACDFDAGWDEYWDRHAGGWALRSGWRYTPTRRSHHQTFPGLTNDHGCGFPFRSTSTWSMIDRMKTRNGGWLRLKQARLRGLIEKRWQAQLMAGRAVSALLRFCGSCTRNIRAEGFRYPRCRHERPRFCGPSSRPFYSVGRAASGFHPRAFCIPRRGKSPREGLSTLSQCGSLHLQLCAHCEPCPARSCNPCSGPSY